MRYKVGVSAAGAVAALDLTLYSNAGNSTDLSPSVMDRSLMHADGCYKVRVVLCRVRVCACAHVCVCASPPLRSLTPPPPS